MLFTLLLLLAIDFVLFRCTPYEFRTSYWGFVLPGGGFAAWILFILNKDI